MANVEMIVDSIRVSMMNYQRVVILKEKHGVRYLPIWIGPSEADAIAVKTQEVELSRPLTHDFACAVIAATGASIQSAVIDKLEDDTFHAKVILQVNKEPKEVDCRPSDAIAVAVRSATPIFAREEVLDKASIVLTEAESLGRAVDEGLPDVFSEDVQHILAASGEEARHMHHDYISTGHLLIALAKKKSTAADVMKNAGVSLKRIQKDMKSLMKKERDVEGGGAGLTPPVKEAIQLSIGEANKLDSEEVLTEHILLGLIRTSDGIAADQLSDSGVTAEKVYTELIRLRKQS